jgi:hypothetical protein
MGMTVRFASANVSSWRMTDAYDPYVWSGRALQEVFVDLSVGSRINVSGL